LHAVEADASFHVSRKEGSSMKGLVAGIALLGLVSMTGCVIDATVETCGTGEFMYNGVCYRNGSSCDFINDQDCVNVAEAWWCSPDGRVYVNDCTEQCAGYGMPFACCGFDPTRGDDACLCCAESTCGGFSCHP